MRKLILPLFIVGSIFLLTILLAYFLIHEKNLLAALTVLMKDLVFVSLFSAVVSHQRDIFCKDHQHLEDRIKDLEERSKIIIKSSPTIITTNLN